MYRSILALIFVLSLVLFPCLAADRVVSRHSDDSGETATPVPFPRPVPVHVVNLPFDAQGNVRVVEQSTQPKQVEVVNFPQTVPITVQNALLDLVDSDVVIGVAGRWTSSVFDVSVFTTQIVVFVRDWNALNCQIDNAVDESNFYAVGASPDNAQYFQASVRGLLGRVSCRNVGGAPVTLQDVKVLLRRE